MTLFYIFKEQVLKGRLCNQEIDHVTIRFNMASEKVDNLKEYIIKLIKKELIFQEFLAVKDVSFKVKRGERGRSLA